jgi:hypothetical protein
MYVRITDYMYSTEQTTGGTETIDFVCDGGEVDYTCIIFYQGKGSARNNISMSSMSRSSPKCTKLRSDLLLL